MAKDKGDQVEVMFTENVTVNGMPYVANRPYMLNREQADSVFLSGHAVEYTEDLRVASERRKMLPQNQPLKESDVIIATHDSGEQVAYKDNREKGPLDAKPTPSNAWTLEDTKKAGGSVEAHRMADARNKAAGKGRRVEELPVGDLPTGVPIGVMEQAQAATKSLKANSSSGPVIDTDAAAEAKAEKDEKKKK